MGYNCYVKYPLLTERQVPENAALLTVMNSLGFGEQYLTGDPVISVDTHWGILRTTEQNTESPRIRQGTGHELSFAELGKVSPVYVLNSKR